MKFGLVYPNSGLRVDRSLAVDTAVAAEEKGFNFMLVWDHYILPDSNKTFETWVLLTYLSAITSSIRLGSCVSPIPFRPPQQFAKVVSTLDQLSEGRIIVGVGAGWHRPEFEAFSEWRDNKTRVDMVDEGVRLMTMLWTEDTVNFEGQFYKTKGATLEPKPVQKPFPEMWFGSTGRRMLRIAAKFGTGWIPTMISVDEYAKIIPKIRSMVGQRKFSYAYNLYNPLRSTKDYVSLTQRLDEAGCEYLAINWKYSKDEWFDRLGWFAREVMPSF